MFLSKLKEIASSRLIQLSLSVLIAIGAICFWWYGRGPQSFPSLAPGSYIGAISGIFEGEAVRVYAERALDSDDFLVILFRKGWSPQIVSSSMRAGSSREWGLPITLHGEGLTIRLVGEQQEGLYSGTVYRSEGNKEGRWILQVVDSVLSYGHIGAEEGLRSWAFVRSELLASRQRVQDAEFQLQQRKEDIAQLSSFVSDKDSAQASADAKYDVAVRELTLQQEIAKNKAAQIRALQEKLALALQVSPMGKLVALARESLEREARWAESMLRTSSETTTQGLDDAVARANSIAELTRQIEEERNAIFKLKYMEGTQKQGKRESTQQSFGGLSVQNEY